MKRALLFLLSAVVLFSCNKTQDPEPPASGTINVKVTASRPISRVSIEETGGAYSMLWDNAGESLKLVEISNDNAASYNSTSCNVSSDRTEAQFSYEITRTSASVYDYYFISPASAFSKADLTLKKLSLYLPAEQTMGEKTPDASSVILYGENKSQTTQSETHQISTDPLSAYCKLSIKNLNIQAGEKLQSIVFKPTGKEITGGMAYSYKDGSYTSLSSITDSVSIKVSNVSSTQNFDVWFSCWPFELGAEDELKIYAVTDKETYSCLVKRTEKYDFSAGHVTKMDVDMSKARVGKLITELYILGSAVESGWDLMEMEPFTDNDGYFTWEGSLKANQEFRFPTQKVANQWWPCILFNEDASKVIYAPDQTEYDNLEYQFTVSETGKYRIEIDTRNFYNLTGTITFISKELAFKELYVIGDATSAGWNIDAMEQFTRDGAVFTWTGSLIAGKDFRFMTQKKADTWFPSLVVSESGNEVTYIATFDEYEAYILLHNLYRVSETGTYKVVVDASDFNNMTCTITPEAGDFIKNLYILGPACSAGWELMEMPAFTNNNGIFTWSGNLTAGQEFRFPTQKVAGVWFPSLILNEDGTQLIYDPDSSEYYKLAHQFTLAETGEYEIVINGKTLESLSCVITKL